MLQSKHLSNLYKIINLKFLFKKLNWKEKPAPYSYIDTKLHSYRHNKEKRSFIEHNLLFNYYILWFWNEKKNSIKSGYISNTKLIGSISKYRDKELYDIE